MNNEPKHTASLTNDGKHTAALSMRTKNAASMSNLGKVSAALANLAKSGTTLGFLLTEAGSFLLRENGDRIVISDAGSLWTNQPKTV